jgi:hypothetical protein
MSVSTNQPGAKRRDKMSLGHSHMALSGKLQSQESESKRSSLALLGEAANVTQITNTSTAVAAHGRHGRITLAATVAISSTGGPFTFTNKYISASNLILLSVSGATAGSALVCSVVSQVDNSCSITLHNASTLAASGAAVINYMILGPDA